MQRSTQTPATSTATETPSTNTPATPVTIAVAVQNDTSCHAAIQWAVDLCGRMMQGATPFKLYFVFVVPQNPGSKFPYLDHLERVYNMEIHSEGLKDMQQLLQHLDQVTGSGRIEYEFAKLEENKNVEEMLAEFVESTRPDMLVVGTHQRNSLKKYLPDSTQRDYKQSRDE